MRLDRAITLGIVKPFMRAVGSYSLGVTSSGCRSAMPILMYHSIAARDESSVHDYFKLSTPPSVFRTQMQTLKDCGYSGVDLNAALIWLKQHGCWPEGKVVITFDDGFRDFFDAALPVLSEFGFTSTMFLPSSLISEDRKSFKGVECMTWGEVREAQSKGTHLGAHTVTHPVLYTLSWSEIREELRGSKAQIEQNLGRPATTFAYPFAFPDADTEFCVRLRELLVSEGYECCVTTNAGRAKFGDDLYSLKRLPMNGADDVELLRSKLGGAYDWVNPAQRFVKRLRNVMNPLRKRLP